MNVQSWLAKTVNRRRQMSSHSVRRRLDYWLLAAGEGLLLGVDAAIESEGALTQEAAGVVLEPSPSLMIARESGVSFVCQPLSD